MTKIMHDSVAVFIDASNVWEAQKAKGRMFDYEKLQAYLKAKFAPKIVRIFFYTAYPREGTRAYSIQGKHSFYTYLKKASVLWFARRNSNAFQFILRRATS